MFSMLTIIGMLILGKIVKKWIIPKFGDHGLYAFLFIVALVINGIHMAMTYYPGFGALMLQAGEFLVSTIGIYEVIFNKMNLPPLTPADLAASK